LYTELERNRKTWTPLFPRGGEGGKIGKKKDSGIRNTTGGREGRRLPYLSTKEENG